MRQRLQWTERVLELSTEAINWQVLRVVDERGRERELALRDLAVEVFERFDGPSEEGPDTVYDTENRLHHKHLPRLDEFDLLAYDRDSETVSAGSNFDKGLQVVNHTMKMVVELSPEPTTDQ
jgi:hypothetical protein